MKEFSIAAHWLATGLVRIFSGKVFLNLSTKESWLSSLTGSLKQVSYIPEAKRRIWNVVFMQFRINSPLCATKQLPSWIWLLTPTMFKFFGSNPLKVNIKLLQIWWNIFRLHTLVAMNWSKNVWGENILSPNNTCKINLRQHQLSWRWTSRAENEW